MDNKTHLFNLMKRHSRAQITNKHDAEHVLSLQIWDMIADGIPGAQIDFGRSNREEVCLFVKDDCAYYEAIISNDAVSVNAMSHDGRLHKAIIEAELDAWLQQRAV